MSSKNDGVLQKANSFCSYTLHWFPYYALSDPGSCLVVQTYLTVVVVVTARSQT